MRGKNEENVEVHCRVYGTLDQKKNSKNCIWDDYINITNQNNACN